MQIIEFKENVWGYSAAEKLEIVFMGIHGVIKNVCSNFHISQTTFRRWRNKYLANVQKIFGRDCSQKKNKIVDESHSIQLGAKFRLLSIVPADIIGKLEGSDEYKAYCIESVKSRESISVKDACKSIGMSSTTFYKHKESSVGDARIRFPALAALDFLLDHKHVDKDSLARKMLTAGIPVSRKEAGSLRWFVLSYIKKNRLREIPAVCQFLNTDDAWAMDFMYTYNDEGKVKYHLKIIDDRSRMDVGNAILDNATTKAALEVLEQAIKNTGRKPKSIKTDRGTQFKLTFSNHLKVRGITHLKSFPQFPTFNAKIERRFKDVRLFSLANPDMDIESVIITEANLHNFVRPHESLGGHTPCVVYWQGADPPFEHPNTKIEYATKWHPSVNTNLKVRITI